LNDPPFRPPTFPICFGKELKSRLPRGVRSEPGLSDERFRLFCRSFHRLERRIFFPVQCFSPPTSPQAEQLPVVSCTILPPPPFVRALSGTGQEIGGTPAVSTMSPHFFLKVIAYVIPAFAKPTLKSVPPLTSPCTLFERLRFAIPTLLRPILFLCGMSSYQSFSPHELAATRRPPCLGVRCRRRSGPSRFLHFATVSTAVYDAALQIGSPSLPPQAYGAHRSAIVFLPLSARPFPLAVYCGRTESFL